MVRRLDPRFAAPALALAIAGAGGAAGSAAPAGTAPGVTVERHPRAVTIDVELPGRVVDLVPACGRGGRCRGVWLLLQPRVEADATGPGGSAPSSPRSAASKPGGDAPRSAPLRLLLFDPAGAADGEPAAPLIEAPVPAPPDADVLAVADLDGDGAPELLAGAPGRLWSLGDPADPGPARLLLEHPSFDLAAVRPLLDPSLPLLPSPAVGALRWYRAEGDGDLEQAGSAPLPIRTRRGAHGLELSSPLPTLLAGTAGAPSRWAAGPEPHGDRRLRSILIDPRSTDGTAVESWSRLPAPESVETAHYLTLDGGPAVAVFTYAADRFGIFDQARLRLFRLGSDRTRAGSAPILAIDTTSHRWQRAAVAVADLDADGRDDVSVAQVKGLGGDAILIETYRRLPGGRFARRPEKLRLDLPGATWRWPPAPVPDLDADHLPDLVALSDGRLLIHTSANRPPGTPLSPTPTWDIPWPEPEDQEEASREEEGDRPQERDQEENEDDRPPLAASRFPATLDLDGDHRPELLRLTRLPNGRDRLRVVLLH